MEVDTNVKNHTNRIKLYKWHHSDLYSLFLFFFKSVHELPGQSLKIPHFDNTVLLVVYTHTHTVFIGLSPPPPNCVLLFPAMFQQIHAIFMQIPSRFLTEVNKDVYKRQE